MTWLDNLINPLRNPKYPQIRGQLVEFGYNNKIIGKCAEGEIACQNGIKYKPHQILLHKEELLKLKIPEDLVDNQLPHFSNLDFTTLIDDNIGDYLYGLNDSNLTYNQIADFLETTFRDAV